jgi:hypothetical protein
MNNFSHEGTFPFHFHISSLLSPPSRAIVRDYSGHIVRDNNHLILNAKGKHHGYARCTEGYV